SYLAVQALSMIYTLSLHDALPIYHEVDRALSEHLFQFLTYHHMGVGLIQIAAQMEIVEPALGRCLLPEAPLHLSLYLLDDGVGDGDEAVRSAGYPVEPVLDYPY